MAYLVALVHDVPLQVARDAELGEPSGRPRFRLTFTDRYPTLLGHVTGLDGPAPLLHVPDRLHRDRARTEGTAATIRDTARFTWHRLLKEATRTD
ncbi:hypothetical protein [Glycomyces tenuis]|uniref:hypothetical protein n=1 Tax=Glycomyces tenuis TaxID=58116 RepID=UPI0003F74DBE|nr:hypothetical protein [Glycomyces tenuis]